MTRQLLELGDADLELVAELTGESATDLRAALRRRPWLANDLLRDECVVDFVLHGDGAAQLRVSPLMFFAVLVNQAASDLSDSSFVDDWIGPSSRLPVFDVEPLQEFTDAPGRLAYMASLLNGFSLPSAAPVPADRYDLDELVDWLAAVGPDDRVVLLRQLGDLALFRAGVFPDSAGGEPLSNDQAERFGRSVQMTDDELDELVDPTSPTSALDALERVGAAWYREAATSPNAPTVLSDIAHRMTSARRFLNHLSDHYLYRLQPNMW